MMAEIVVVVAQNTVANVSVKIQVIRTLSQVRANIYYSTVGPQIAYITPVLNSAKGLVIACSF